ncbi:MAG: hypothetical protein ACJ8GL_07360, partial [Bacillus sp. (in: firmicutes)]
MEFVINQQMLKSVSATDDNTSMLGSLFYAEKEAFSGVKRIARKVMHDVELVFGYTQQATTDKKKLGKHAVLYGTVDHSPMLHELQEKKM